MKITLWSINYHPEPTGIAPYNHALCEFLVRKGHEVEVVTSFPYYPQWLKSPEDSSAFYRREERPGITLHRCWTFVPKRLSTLKRIIHEASFVFTSFARVLFLRRPEAYIVISPPLLLGAAAWLISILKRVPYIFHVQDMQPDAAVGLGMMRTGLFTNLLFRLEALAYSKAARVSGITPGMIEAFSRKGVPAERTLYFPNGVILPQKADFPMRGNFRKTHSLSNLFIAVYSGNLGNKQGLEILIEAALLLDNPKIRIFLCGDGARKRGLQELIDQWKVRNVRMLPLLSDDEYREMLVDVDLCLITQKRGSGTCFFPSKLLNTLAYGKAVLTVSEDESELARSVHSGRYGVNVPPENPQLLAKALELMARDDFPLSEIGDNGRRFVERFEMQRTLQSFLDELLKLREPSKPLVEWSQSKRASQRV